MKRYALPLALLAAVSMAMPGRAVDAAGLDDIETIVVLYAENRSFDNLYGRFPGANGLSQLTQDDYLQVDRDGWVLKELPPVWGGLTPKGVVPVVTEAKTRHVPNAPFAIDDPKGWNAPVTVVTQSPVRILLSLLGDGTSSQTVL